MTDCLFELCAESLEAAKAAEAGGAGRVELCSRLTEGGVTPPPEMMAAAVQMLSIPVHVLVRPRAGGFVYSPQEFGSMQSQIAIAKSAGAAGVALGILLTDGRVDIDRTSDLVELARPMDVTFHRAFDETRDLEEALEDVIRTGSDSLLTSGGAPDVLTGAESVAALSAQAGERISIIAGGGLRLGSIAELVRRSGVFCLHGSLARDGRGALLEFAVREAVHLLRVESENRAQRALAG
jgi:copper homeostasis protein